MATPTLAGVLRYIGHVASANGRAEQSDADAPIAGKLSDFSAKPTDAKLDIKGEFEQTIDLVTGGNNTPYYQAHVDKLALAVTEDAPFKLTLVEPKVPLVQNGSMELKVKAERKSGFNGPITIRMLFNPPGTTAGTTATMVLPDHSTQPLTSDGTGRSAALVTESIGRMSMKI